MAYMRAASDPTVAQVDDDMVLVGRILGPVGLGGEVRVELFSDVPQRFAEGTSVIADGIPLRVQRRRLVTRGLVIKFQETSSRKAAEALRGKALYVHETDVPSPPKDTYYHYQLLDMQMVTVDGKALGRVTDIISTGANDVFVVSTGEKEILVPAIAQVVVEVDVQGRRMVVDLPKGL